jgi:hypothetical protein
MREISALVDRLVPGLLGRGPRSVVCIWTTRPKYLVFEGDGTRPVCIVEFGPTDRLNRVHEVQSTLHARLPGRVPRSICCLPHLAGTAVRIQQGLPGVPWFRLADQLAGPADWEHLLDRALIAMHELHGAIRDVPAWSARVDLGSELALQAAEIEMGEVQLSPLVRRRVSDWAHTLERLGPVRAVRQHGDFAINNLLVSSGSVAIIDFDEFGHTVMPLHDAFGLALSLPLSQGGSWPIPRARCIARCVQQALADGDLQAEHLPGLLMHHLLCRINLCRGIERRAPLRETLLAWTNELAEEPLVFLADVWGVV